MNKFSSMDVGNPVYGSHGSRAVRQPAAEQSATQQHA
jgi:hypothetical protein